MRGRLAGLAAVAMAATGGVLTMQSLWPAPGASASVAGGRVTQVSLPAVGVAAVPVCPGPQSLVAPDGGTAVEPGGPVVVGAIVESVEGRRPATLSGVALTGGEGGFALRTAPRTSAGLVTLQAPSSSTVPVMSAVQVSLRRSGDLRGLTALACPTTATRTWLVGGGTQAGRRGQLVLANPAGAPAEADVTVYGPRGPVSAPAGTGIVIPAGGVLALRIDALAPDLDAVAVLVQARGGRISATLQDSYVRGLTPSGVDDITAAAPAARRQVVPGISVAVPAGTGLPEASGAPGGVAVRVVNPGSVDVVARVRLLGEAGPVEVGGGVLTLAAGEVRDVVVTRVPEGIYSAVVEADAPVVAGAVVGRAPSAGAAAGAASPPRASTLGAAAAARSVGPAAVTAGRAATDATGRPSDFGWAASVEALSGATLVALPAVTENAARATIGGVLTVAAPDGAGSFELVQLDGEGHRIETATVLLVPAGTSSRYTVSPKAAAVRLRPLDGSSTLMAAVVLQAPDPSGPMIAVLPVRPGPAGQGDRPYVVSDVRAGLG